MGLSGFKGGKALLALLLIAKVLMYCSSSGNNYYVDSISGNDENNGLSPRKAWRTLSHVSRASYGSGDRILLKGGQRFPGTLRLKSLPGQDGRPVTISSYGKGRAVISSGDSVAIDIMHSSHVDIKNIICRGSGRLNGNLTNGLVLTQSSYVIIDNVEASGFLYSGILVRGGRDVRITNAYTHDNGYCGVQVTGSRSRGSDSGDRFARNIYIGYSVAENNPGCPAIKNNHSGNGILVGNSINVLVEYCEAFNNGWDMPRPGNGPVGIWAHDSDSVIIQHCFSHHNKTSEQGHDGGGFDFDGGMTNSIMQYNLSSLNEGAGYGIFQYRGAGTWENNIMRYNISYNDGVKNGRTGIFVWVDLASKVQMTNFHAYNNTIVTEYGAGVYFTPGHYESFVFENNIFLLTEESESFIRGESSGALFDNNLYYTFNLKERISQPGAGYDINAVIADPLLVLPSATSLDHLRPETMKETPYFKLQPGSPARNMGKKIAGSGRFDFWGFPIPETANPNIGAHSE